MTNMAMPAQVSEEVKGVTYNRRWVKGVDYWIFGE